MEKQILLRDLEPGMVLSRPILNSDGTLLMSEGTMLTDFVIGLIKSPAYLAEVLPFCDNVEEMTLYVAVPDQPEELSDEDMSHVGSVRAADPRLPPDPHSDSLLDPEYVETYEKVLDELQRILNPKILNRGIDLDAIGTLIANRQLDKLCDGARAVAQIHNMDREGSYLLHHSLHVAILAGLMGRWLHWSAEYRERLIIAGLLHDVGKLRIADDILNKPGKLTTAEMNIVRRHSAYGADILSKCGLGDETDIVAGVLQHHERCDGSGYPGGLKKDFISPFGKILAILDIYDAMAANRAYAHKVSPFEIFDRLTSDMMAGKIDAEYGVLFVRKICHALTGSWVLLENGEKAKIIYIDQSRTNSLPIVETTNGQFYDLAHDRRAKIVELLTLQEAKL